MIFKYYHIHFDSMNRFGCIESTNTQTTSAATKNFFKDAEQPDQPKYYHH